MTKIIQETIILFITICSLQNYLITMANDSSHSTHLLIMRRNDGDTISIDNNHVLSCDPKESICVLLKSGNCFACKCLNKGTMVMESIQTKKGGCVREIAREDCQYFLKDYPSNNPSLPYYNPKVTANRIGAFVGHNGDYIKAKKCVAKEVYLWQNGLWISRSADDFYIQYDNSVFYLVMSDNAIKVDYSGRIVRVLMKCVWNAYSCVIFKVHGSHIYSMTSDMYSTFQPITTNQTSAATMTTIPTLTLTKKKPSTTIITLATVPSKTKPDVTVPTKTKPVATVLTRNTIFPPLITTDKPTTAANIITTTSHEEHTLHHSQAAISSKLSSRSEYYVIIIVLTTIIIIVLSLMVTCFILRKYKGLSNQQIMKLGCFKGKRLKKQSVIALVSKGNTKKKTTKHSTSSIEMMSTLNNDYALDYEPLTTTDVTTVDLYSNLNKKRKPKAENSNYYIEPNVSKTGVKQPLKPLLGAENIYKDIYEPGHINKIPPEYKQLEDPLYKDLDDHLYGEINNSPKKSCSKPELNTYITPVYGEIKNPSEYGEIDKSKFIAPVYGKLLNKSSPLQPLKKSNNEYEIDIPNYEVLESSENYEKLNQNDSTRPVYGELISKETSTYGEVINSNLRPSLYGELNKHTRLNTENIYGEIEDTEIQEQPIYKELEDS